MKPQISTRMTIVFLIAAIVLFSGCLSVPYVLLKEPLTDRPKKVAAFYYGWYSRETNYSQTDPFPIIDDDHQRHWFDAEHPYPDHPRITNIPELGFYDCADPAIIETHLRQAEWAGLDAFICSYWGYESFEFANFINMLQVAKAINSNVTLAPYYEIFMKGMTEKPDIQAEEIFYQNLKELYVVMTTPEFAPWIWFEDDKPVLFVYVSQALNKTVWQATISRLASEGMEFFIAADRPGSDPQLNALFQASHQYDVYAPTYHGNYFNDFLKLKERAAQFDQLFIAGVAPGYNDTVERCCNPPLVRRDGETYRQSWENALTLKPDWITITSWNEWHEGTEIEPSVENGDLALNQTKNFVEQFKTGNMTGFQDKSALLFSGNLYYGIISMVVLAVILSLVILYRVVVPTRRKPSSLERTLGLGMVLIAWGGLATWFILEIYLTDFGVISAEAWILFLPLLALLHWIGARQIYRKGSGEFL